MKAPMQELIEFMEQRINDSNRDEQRSLMGMITVVRDCYLEKEKGLLIQFCNYGYRKGVAHKENHQEFKPYETAEQYYNEQ